MTEAVVISYLMRGGAGNPEGSSYGAISYTLDSILKMWVQAKDPSYLLLSHQQCTWLQSHLLLLHHHHPSYGCSFTSPSLHHHPT